MMGIVFTEFFSFVEGAYGEDMVDELIDACDLPSGGAYTSVGAYDHLEMVHLVSALAKETNQPVGAHLGAFGEHLATRFGTLFPDFFAAHEALFPFLGSIEDKIHVEVRKLYPNAQLPRIDASELSATRMRLDYRSCRQMEALAEGLIRGAATHFGEPVAIARETLDIGGERVVRFTVEARA